MENNQIYRWQKIAISVLLCLAIVAATLEVYSTKSFARRVYVSELPLLEHLPPPPEIVLPVVSIAQDGGYRGLYRISVQDLAQAIVTEVLKGNQVNMVVTDEGHFLFTPSLPH